MKSNYEERKARRIERFKELAAKNESQSEQQFSRASEMASVIPLGQPILVGHHSESRGRSYRKKIERLNDKALESSKKADYYGQRAASAENSQAISSDDPNAVDKLKEKLQGMEKLQVFMKSVNRIVRNKKLTLEEKTVQILKGNILNNMWDTPEAEKLCKTGFEKYQLQNNSQNMARVRKRIEELESMSKMESSEVSIGDVKIKTNVEDNRLQIFFPGKPDEITRADLKRHGFRWSPSVGAWQRQISNMAAYYAFEIVNNMTKAKGE